MPHVAKKIALIALAVAVIAAAVVGLLAYRAYNRASAENADIPVPEFTLSPGKEIKLGDDIKIATEILCPWGHIPKKAELDLAEGLQVVSEPKIEKLKTKWGKDAWRISAEIQPYRTGEVKPSKCSIEIAWKKNDSTVRKTIEGKIPGFKVLAVDTGGKRSLDLADRAKPVSTMERHHWLRWLVALGVCAVVLASLVGAFVAWKLRKARLAEQEPPPWVVALSSLAMLKNRVESGELDREACVAELSDIIRNYLEKRFEVKATSSTTKEFLTGMERGDSPLEAEHRLFLRDFMTAADLVKFAKLPVDDSVVDDAIAKARLLVESTVPAPDDEDDVERKEAEDV